MASQNPQYTSAPVPQVNQMAASTCPVKTEQSNHFRNNTSPLSQVPWYETSQPNTYSSGRNQQFPTMAAPQITQIGGLSGQSNTVPLAEFQYNESSVSQVPWSETSQPVTYSSWSNPQYPSMGAPQAEQTILSSGQMQTTKSPYSQHNTSCLNQVPWKNTMQSGKHFSGSNLQSSCLAASRVAQIPGPSDQFQTVSSVQCHHKVSPVSQQEGTSRPGTYFSGSNPPFPSFAAPQATQVSMQSTNFEHNVSSVDQFKTLQSDAYFFESNPQLPSPAAPQVDQIGGPSDQFQTVSSLQFHHNVSPVGQREQTSQPETYFSGTKLPFPSFAAPQANQGPMQSSHFEHNTSSVDQFQWKQSLQSDEYSSESNPQLTSSVAPRVDQTEDHSDQFQSVPVNQFQHNVSSLRQVPWKQNSLPEMYISGSDPKFLSFAAPEVNQKVNQPSQIQTAQSVRFSHNAPSVNQDQFKDMVNPKTHLSGSKQAGEEKSILTLCKYRCTCPNCQRGGVYDGKQKVHVCHIGDCKKVFRNPSYLKRHIRVHTGERPFTCGWPFCGKAYTYLHVLKEHEAVVHTGLFRCNECSKNFKNRSALEYHSQTYHKFGPNDQELP